MSSPQRAPASPMTHGSGSPTVRAPWTISLVSLGGLLAGFFGLFMVMLGIGIISPTIIDIPGINLHIQSATPGIVVMAIGFTVALVPVVMVLHIAAIQANRGNPTTANQTSFRAQV